MQPGAPCNACHQQLGGPALRLAGTVYPTLHEVDQCNGSRSPTLEVVVTDKNNVEHKMLVNDAGNFLWTMTTVPAPFRARVTDGTRTRAMLGSVTSGDCNSCHTQAGKNGAPGRIVAP